MLKRVETCKHSGKFASFAVRQKVFTGQEANPLLELERGVGCNARPERMSYARCATLLPFDACNMAKPQQFKPVQLDTSGAERAQQAKFCYNVLEHLLPNSNDASLR